MPPGLRPPSAWCVVGLAACLAGCNGGNGAASAPAPGEKTAAGPSSTPPATAATQTASTASNKPRPRDLDTYMVLFDLGTYESKIAPAFDKYVSTGDTGALSELIRSGGEAIPNLADRKQRFEAAQKLAGPLVEARCLVKVSGSEPYQLGPSELVSYLYSASDWLRETLTARDISDISLDYPLGELTEIIRPVDAAEIRVNVRNIPMPEDAAIRKQLAALLAMMDAAGKNPKHVLALVMK